MVGRHVAVGSITQGDPKSLVIPVVRGPSGVFADLGHDVINDTRGRSERQPHEEIVVIREGDPLVEANGRRDIAPNDHRLHGYSGLRGQNRADERAFAGNPVRAGPDWRRVSPLIEQPMPAITPTSAGRVLEARDLRGQFRRTPCVIGVDEPDEAGRGRLEGGIADSRDIARVGHRDNSNPSIGWKGPETAVGRPIVPNEKLPLLAGLALHGCDRFEEQIPPVIRGEDDADKGDVAPHRPIIGARRGPRHGGVSGRAMMPLSWWYPYERCGGWSAKPLAAPPDGDAPLNGRPLDDRLPGRSSTRTQRSLASD